MPTAGRNAFLSVGGTDISTHCNDISVPEEIEADETTTFGTDAKTYIAGLADGSVSLSGVWDPAVDTVWAAVRQQNDQAFQYGPQGNTVSNPRRTGVMVGTNYETSQTPDGVVEFSMELQIDGGITFDTF